MMKYILVFILGFISYIGSYKLIKRYIKREIKIEKAICEEYFDCTLKLSPSTIPKDKDVVVRHNLSLHTLDKKSIGNLPFPRGRDILFEKYCPGNENEDKTLIVATKLDWKEADYHIERGVKLIFLHENNYYLGETVSQGNISAWRMRSDGPREIEIVMSIDGKPGSKVDVKLCYIIAKVKNIFADWHCE